MKNDRYFAGIVYTSIVFLFAISLFNIYFLVRVEKDYNEKYVSLAGSIISLQEKLQQNQNYTKSLFSKIEDTILDYDVKIGELNQQVSDLSVESESFSLIISDVIDSVVSIYTDVSQGSGAIISSDGYVITNYHVMQGAKKAGILAYSGDTYGIKLIGYNENSDIAVLKIISNETFDYLEFGDSNSLKAGQKVVALGNPAGLSFTATEGIISNPLRLIDGKTFIQTDVTINPGNSGGPLINSKGEITGIVEFKVFNYEGLGFAIPSNRAKKIFDEITY